MMQKYEHLVKWVRENGGDIDSSVYLDCEDPGNRSLRVNSAQCPGTVLINVPDKCGLGGDDVYSTCMNLLLEISKGESSFYKPFIDTLPTPDQLAEMPLYRFTRANLQELQEVSGQFAQIMNNYFTEIETFFSEHVSKSVDLPEGYKKYHYALYVLALYHSRAWNKKGFIPLIEFIQHDNNVNLSNSVVFNNDFNNFVARKYIKKGEELTWFYSLSTNLSMLANYGIPALSPVYFPSALTFNPTKDTDVTRYQKECLKENGISTEQSEIKFVYTETGLHVDAYVVGRILQLNERDLGYIKLENDGKLEPLKFSSPKIVSMRNEVAMVKTFLKQLNDYATNIKAGKKSEKYKEINECVKKNLEVVEKGITQLKEYWNSLLESTDGVKY